MTPFTETMSRGGGALGSRVHAKKTIEVGGDVMKMDIRENRRETSLWMGLDMVRETIKLSVFVLLIRGGHDRLFSILPKCITEDGQMLTNLSPKLFFFFSYLSYLFLAALGLPCCARAFSSCSEWGPLFVVVHGLLIAVASLVVEHGF